MHSFCPNDASKYGVEAAVLLQNIRWWCEKNKANNKHFYKGRYWTYNSHFAFISLFPYFNKDKIRRLIEKLVKSSAIFIDYFNENKFDRTAWYSVNNEASVSHNRIEDAAELPQDKNKSAISLIYTDINTDINICAHTQINSEPKKNNITKNNKNPVNSNLNFHGLDIDQQIIKDFFILRKANKSPLTQTVLNSIIKQANIAGVSLNDAGCLNMLIFKPI